MADETFSPNVPFSPYNFEIPEGRIDCYLDTEALPNELRITGTENVIAYYQNGEFSIPFQLDSTGGIYPIQPLAMAKNTAAQAIMPNASNIQRIFTIFLIMTDYNLSNKHQYLVL